MDNKLICNKKSVLFYNDDDGNIQIEVLLKDGADIKAVSKRLWHSTI